MSGRRSEQVRGGRLAPTVVLAVVLPLLVLLSALAVGGPDEVAAPGAQPPSEAALTRSTLVCPRAADGGRVVVGSDAGAPGTVAAGEEEVEVGDGVTAGLDDDGSVEVTGEGERAPGLVAGRSARDATSAVDCPPPSSDQWFTGVGAGGAHTSVLELHNPDGGPAVADVAVYSQSGALDAERLRGVAVGPGRTLRLDLAELVPRREELTLRVTTDRGRIAATVVDSFEELGAAAASREWLPSQAEPRTDNLLLGVPPGDGRRTLVVANPGDDAVRVQVGIVTAQSVFAPEELPELVVDPGSVKVVSLGALLSSPAADGALGLALTSSAPVTATLRSSVDGDLAETVAGPLVTGATAAVVPPGPGGAELVLGGAATAGVVEVEAWDAEGRPLRTRRTEVGPDRGTSLALPAGAVLVRVVPSRAEVVASLLRAGPDGSVVVPLRDLVRSALVPAVRPGLG
ncbi:DUF5719 family protein [Nocardioides kribbensis]|uniref:DUF5719 family protein n=1 Tax=Nocardioides kribbensis TaxID=305517 RepID=A0ABV1NTV3_9ACTN